MPGWASPVRIYTGGALFRDIAIVQNDDFSMHIGCGDTDPEDGYTWDLSLKNESTDKVLAISFRNSALNSMMCETDAWDASGWTLKGGEERKQTITWTAAAMQDILVKNVETVAFELKVYENNHFQEADGAIVDELFLVDTSEAVPAGTETEEELPEEEETETEEILPEEEETGEETAEELLSADLFRTGGTLYRDKRYSMQLMSAGEDAEGIPVWKVILENNTEDTVLFELQEAEVNGWAITPYWTQTVHPHMMAVSEISWWNMDIDISLIEEFRSASFVLRIWKAEKGWNPVYQQGERFAVSIGETTKDEASGEDAEEMTEDPEEQPEEQKDTGTVLYTGTSCTVRADEVLAEPAAGYGMVRLHVENTGDQTKTFAVERVSYNGQRLSTDWKQVIPANSVKNSVLYLDLQGTEEDLRPETLVLHLNVSEGKTALFGDDVSIDLEEWYPEPETAAEDEENDAYTDMDTLTILQHALKDAGFDPGTIDGKMGSDTRNAIRKYREQKGLSEGAAVDDELLFALGIADADTYQEVQEALNKAGYDCGKPEGVPGDQTRKSIRSEEHTSELQ